MLLLNLKTSGTKKKRFELDFETDKNDILIAEKSRHNLRNDSRRDIKMDYSLRAYLEILYKETTTRMFLRGTKINIQPMEGKLQMSKL